MVIALVFAKNDKTEETIKFVRNTISRIRIDSSAEDNVLTIHAQEDVLNNEGETQAVYKIRESSDYGPWHSFKCGDVDVSMSEFVAENKEEFRLGDDDKLWTAAEEVFLTMQLLQRLQFNLWQFGKQLDMPELQSRQKEEQPLLLSLQREGILEDVVVLHDHAKRKQFAPYPECGGLSADWIDSMKDYFGAKVAFYFVFMRMFTFWLILPGILGLLIFILRTTSVDDSPIIPFFSCFMVCYSTIFLRVVERENAHWACRWGMSDVNRRFVKQANFHGTWATSPITGEPELTYPFWKRCLWYAFSAGITSLMLAVSFGVMIVSLNLQGYIHSPTSVVAEGIERFASPFWIEFIAKWAEPGALFDPTGKGDYLCFGYVTFIPVILHVVVILFLNSVYSRIADWLTTLENHETESARTRSLCFKRFFFEAFDCYVVLFYIAFYMRDVEKLRSELVGLYTVDSLRRVLLETVIPMIKQQLTKVIRDWKAAQSKKTDDHSSDSTQHVSNTLLDELAQDEYEDYDDWLEMVIQFGYITLFAGAFPLAACLSFFCNIIEVSSDAFKLTRVYRRPLAERAASMPETWMIILKSMVVLSIITNCLIFCVCSEQMMTWFPFLYEEDQFHNHVPKSQSVMWLLFIIEHSVSLVCVMLYMLIPSVPNWVEIAFARKDYFLEKILHEEFLKKREVHRKMKMLCNPDTGECTVKMKQSTADMLQSVIYPKTLLSSQTLKQSRSSLHLAYHPPLSEPRGVVGEASGDLFDSVYHPGLNKPQGVVRKESDDLFNFTYIEEEKKFCAPCVSSRGEYGDDSPSHYPWYNPSTLLLSS